MKVEWTKEKPEFTPVVITITLFSTQEIKVLKSAIAETDAGHLLLSALTSALWGADK